MKSQKHAAGKEERLYAFHVSFSFNMQFTFTEKEVQSAEAEGGGPNDLEPTERALSKLEQEVEEYLSMDYAVDTIEAFADCDSLLGTIQGPNSTRPASVRAVAKGSGGECRAGAHGTEHNRRRHS
jgi:hypothetical protein